MRTSNGRHWHQWLACNDAATLTNDGDEALAQAMVMAAVMATVMALMMMMMTER